MPKKKFLCGIEANYSVKSGRTMNAAPKLLATLHAHADRYGESLCHVLPDRVITYRRLWSRIERASARLHGEWGVRQHDVVAYAGNAHPDAIVLYCALLRIGAVLLPLEAAPPTDWDRLQQQASVRLMVHNAASSTVSAFSLPLLLADWCHSDPVLVVEDPAAAGLLLPMAGKLQPVCSQQLISLHAAEPLTALVGDTLFDLATLTTIIVPALINARALQFSAVAKNLR
jgi:acyl-CoA synthetase (AMP-forming)/AMP-acid ligase II